MSPGFERIGIAGVGLLGASLGLALKKRGLARCVVGAGRRRETLETALRLGAIDEIADAPAALAAGTELVVLAAPAAAVPPLMDSLRGTAAVVTDVASTKGVICAHAAGTWPSPRRFVGGHPMAGSENAGPEHGRADLYEGAVCLLEDSPGLDPAAVDTVRRLWEAVGMRVAPIAPQLHDALLARTSHLPHVAAAALAALAGAAPLTRDVVGRGFLDTTRIAGGPPEVWRDICLTNREALLESLSEYGERLETFIRLLRDGDSAGLEAFFAEGRAARRGVTGE